MRTSHFTLPTILPNGSGMPVLALLYITPASISVTEPIFPWTARRSIRLGKFVTNAYLYAV